MFLKLRKESWCIDCVGCTKLEIESFQGIPKTKDCIGFRNAYSFEEKAERLRNEQDYYGSAYRNNF